MTEDKSYLERFGIETLLGKYHIHTDSFITVYKHYI